jgi:subtilisin family serine protease
MSDSRFLSSSVYQPKLRMFYNGNTDVNVIRADANASVAVKDPQSYEQIGDVRAVESPTVQLDVQQRPQWSKDLSENVLVSVFLDLTDEAQSDFALPADVEARSFIKRGNIAVAEVPLVHVDKLAQRTGITEVSHISLGEPLVAPRPRITAGDVEPPRQNRWRVESIVEHRGGESVLIGLIDVEGFDFTHEDFLDSEGRTRFVRIWDQGGDVRPAPAARPGETTYGAEFTQEHLDNAIQLAKTSGIPAYELEPQSQMAPGSHGTHVASIVAGNRGICPNALIAGVVISLPSEDYDRRASFYDSTRIAHAFDYLTDLANEMGLPISINISLGTNGHAHDSSSDISRWIDSALAEPGRSVSVAAGNAGQEVSTSPDDIGYIMGRVHTRGHVASRGLDSVIDWVVVGDGISDLSENELEIWYSPQDRFSVEVRPPGGDWIGPIEPGQFVENRLLPGPRGGFVSIYNELYHPTNGANYIAIYLSPTFDPSGVTGVPPGIWKVRLRGLEVRDGIYHGWIERDDPSRMSRLGHSEPWSFPSFLGDASYVDESTVSSLGCGHWIISVGNYDEAASRINITSSQGPTRDGRFKPDVAAVGTDVVAAKGFMDSNDQWVAMSGTSMAAPFVAGITGLMLGINRELTAAQILGIIQSTSRPLPGADYTWRNDAGFGVIDPKACLDEAARVGVKQDRTNQ